jgi:hypothetical protein
MQARHDARQSKPSGTLFYYSYSCKLGMMPVSQNRAVLCFITAIQASSA